MVTHADRSDRFDDADPLASSAEASNAPRAYRPRGADMSANAVTDRGHAANRVNAQHSTGPRTADGKARAARNSTSHGIFCRDLLLDGEDDNLFRNIRESVIRRLRPQDALELMFVDRLVQAQWRLNRCQGAERLAHQEQAAAVRRRAAGEAAELRRYHGFETRAELAQRGRRGDDAVLERLDELDELCDPERQPGLTLMLGISGGDRRRGAGRGPGRAFDRLGNYEQRLERTMQRALRELRLLRSKDARAWEELPESPYSAAAVGPEPTALTNESRVDGENDPPSPRRGEDGGEAGARGVGDARSAKSSSIDLRNRPSRGHTVPPHPNPLPAGEREPTQRKNEPVSALTHLTTSTGENSLVEPVGDIAVATSSVPAGSSPTGSENDATPDALVVTDSDPTSVRPPPANNSM